MHREPSDAPEPSAPTSLRRRFARLTAFNILANLTVPLAGLVDTAMLGHLADIRFLAGVALAAILFDFLYWSLGFLRMGTTGTAAQALGAGDRPALFLVLYRSLVLAVGIAALVLAGQWLLREGGFALLSGTPGVEAAGRDYFNARIWGAPATLANFAFIGWLLGREESGRALVASATGNLANVALNYLFIIRMGLAAQGAGLATAGSQYLMLLVNLGFVATSGPLLPWSWREVLNRAGLAGLVRLNRDILVRSLLLATAFALFTNFSSILGTAVLAANSILLRLAHVASYLIDGVAFACESLAGIFRGRGDAAAFRRLLRLAHLSGLALVGVFLLVILPFQRPVYRLLTSHEEVVALAATYGPWLLPLLLAGAAAFVYDGLFLGLTEGRALRDAMLVSAGAVYLPLALVALALGSAHLLWLAFTAFMAARAGTLAWAGRRVFPSAEGEAAVAGAG